MYDNKKLLLLLLICLLVLLYISCVLINTPKIYNQLHSQVKKEVPKEVVKKEIKNTENKIIKKVEQKSDETPKVEKAFENYKYPEIEISKKNNNITVSGIFSSAEDSDSVMELLKKFSASTNKGYIKIDELVSKEKKWLNILQGIAYYFAKSIEKGEITFSDNEFLIEGKVLNKGAKKDIEDLLQTMNDLDIKIKSNISIMKPITPNQKVKKNIYDILKSQSIEFEKGKAIIKKETYPLLDSIIEVLSKEDNLMVLIEGHTSNGGDAIINQILSLDRADAIKEYFIKQGIDETRLDTIGYGEDRPAFSYTTKIGKNKNSRIEFTIKGD